MHPVTLLSVCRSLPVPWERRHRTQRVTRQGGWNQEREPKPGERVDQGWKELKEKLQNPEMVEKALRRRRRSLGCQLHPCLCSEAQGKKGKTSRLGVARETLHRLLGLYQQESQWPAEALDPHSPSSDPRKVQKYKSHKQIMVLQTQSLICLWLKILSQTNGQTKSESSMPSRSFLVHFAPEDIIRGSTNFHLSHNLRNHNKLNYFPGFVFTHTLHTSYTHLIIYY